MNKKQKWTIFTWWKLLNFCLMLALIMSAITVFVGEFVEPLYGDSINLGFGIIIIGVAWILWNNLSLQEKISKLYAKEIIFILILITGSVLTPSIITLSLMGSMIISSFGFIWYKHIIKK